MAARAGRRRRARRAARLLAAAAGRPADARPADRPAPAADPGHPRRRVRVRDPRRRHAPGAGGGLAAGATPYATLLAAYAALLARYCGQGDIPIGTPLASGCARRSPGCSAASSTPW
ncbi:hypothetical protein ACFQ1I_39495 [Kitasatospora arboriphila]